MSAVAVFLIIVPLAATLIILMSVPWKGVITIATTLALAVLSGTIAVRALTGAAFIYTLPGSFVTGEIPVRIDALSALFILIINFTFITGALYGFQYMKAYRAQKSNLSLHCISFILVQASLIAICSVQNTLVFLLVWEIMAVCSFVLVIFEHERRETIRAGLNFLIQSHVCILILTFGFIWIATRMHSYDFEAIRSFTEANSLLTGVVLFLCFFTGFAIKAGFVPFHTWLPYAHPVAPSHISGIMSGVIIKIGIYGILRMLLLIKCDYLLIGYIILFISILTGIYGVMLAIIQHNLKRLLAYHSIENIGIIGIGIGLGSIGLGKENMMLVVLGFAGALLHTLNHSLFKSLLFYGAGNVYQSTHTMDIEKLGGILKYMPQTTLLFLIASLAICGLPPFNGFVSEFLIYNGMFIGLHSTDKSLLSSLVAGLFGLALIGGLAMLCFTKAFGSVFLGTTRIQMPNVPVEAGLSKLFPMYVILLCIMAIGLFPGLFMTAFWKPIELFAGTRDLHMEPAIVSLTETLSGIGIGALLFLLVSGLIYFIRCQLISNKPRSIDVTWGCGYVLPSAKMQYTASSFIRAYRKLVEPILSVRRKKTAIQEIFPVTGGHETHPYDRVEEWFIDYPLHLLKLFFNRFVFLQNGNLQFYILYGIVFITLVLGIPFMLSYIGSVIDFLNTL